MAATIMSQDILAICLLLSDGNLDLNLKEVILRAEEYQETQGRHFGISRSDFRGLFQLQNWEYEMDAIKMRDIINDILEYHDAYFNDEGEYWYKGDDVESQDKVKQQMKRFFSPQEISQLHPKLVREFMAKMNITEAILYHCSRSGESS